MLTPDTLLELHRRTHAGTSKLLEHCGQFGPEELSRDLGGCGFGYPDLLEQWRHIIGTEDYWVSVLQGAWDIPDHAAACGTVAELEARRAVVASQTAAYLAETAGEALSTPAEFACWPEGTRRMLIPAMVVMRTLTHAFQHRGQVVAMCRVLGRPCPPSDFPLQP